MHTRTLALLVAVSAVAVRAQDGALDVSGFAPTKVAAQPEPPEAAESDAGPRAEGPNPPLSISPGDDTYPERFRRSRVPPGFHLVQGPTWGLVAGGTGAFLFGYLSVAVVGILTGAPLDAVPFIGPFLAFRTETGWFSGLGNGLMVAGIVLDVSVQLAGVGMFIAGLAVKKRWLERDLSEPIISFVPSAPGAPLGASLVGRF